jgi:hypothetical protein
MSTGRVTVLATRGDTAASIAAAQPGHRLPDVSTRRFALVGIVNRKWRLATTLIVVPANSVWTEFPQNIHIRYL